MNIGPYTFEEFRQLAANFHGYAAPGLLIGGYMVEKAKQALPEGTLFEAVVESGKCLPDAVQLLTLCSIGNQRLKIDNLGRYAVSLFDKHTGQGFRVGLDVSKMEEYPELAAWFLKRKPKQDQDAERLELEIRQAGDSICTIEPITIKPRFIGHKHMAAVGICPICQEAYPLCDSAICRGCQGEAPYISTAPGGEPAPVTADAATVPVEEAVGKTALHDMTRIEPGQFKGPEFRKGQLITPGDVCRLQQMGRFTIAVENEAAPAGVTHENEAAIAFARRMAGPGIFYDCQPVEGKIDFLAAFDGLLCVDEEKLKNFNLVPNVMAASRQDGSLVKKGAKLAGTRAIPLYLEKKYLGQALEALAVDPLFEVKPFRKAKAGILVTGTEVFKGLIKDKFIPVITAKLLDYGADILESVIVPDERQAIHAAVERMIAEGIDLLITTGGLSVDPDDITRQAILDLGLSDVVHGMPVLPGAMSMTGKIRRGPQEIQVIGVPACALYFKTTFLDLVLPRLLAGRDFTRQEAARMGSGGYCLACKVCSWPKCTFGK